MKFNSDRFFLYQAACPQHARRWGKNLWLALSDSFAYDESAKAVTFRATTTNEEELSQQRAATAFGSHGGEKRPSRPLMSTDASCFLSCPNFQQHSSENLVKVIRQKD